MAMCHTCVCLHVITKMVLLFVNAHCYFYMVVRVFVFESIMIKTLHKQIVCSRFEIDTKVEIRFVNERDMQLVIL